MSIGIRGGYEGLISSSVALSSSGGSTTSDAINIDYTLGNFSLQTETSDANFDVAYTASIDGITYYTPVGGSAGVILSSQLTNCIISMDIIPAKSIKIVTTNNNVGSNLTITKQTIFFNEK